eukprot:6205164-Pleurochrysis_carterae.AAC.1
MASTGGGAIVNTASVAALQCTPTMVAYVASKAAVLGMTVAAAKVTSRKHTQRACSLQMDSIENTLLGAK